VLPRGPDASGLAHAQVFGLGDGESQPIGSIGMYVRKKSEKVGKSRKKS
jgi:hypothetical protein